MRTRRFLASGCVLESAAHEDLVAPCRAAPRGEVLHISDTTVERHPSNVLDKLGLRDRVALTRYAIRRGLVEP